MEELNLYRHTDDVNELLARYGVKFGIYKNNVFKEQLFPFDAIPRIIPAKEYSYLERGLKQRVMALNLFIKDIYGEKKIIKDKVVPEEFVYASSGYLAQCEGVMPSKGIYYFVPRMIKYYLKEEPILKNAPTYLPFYEEDMQYVLEHFDDLVLKDVAEAGGYGVVFANKMTKQEKDDFITLLKREPRRFIAQEVIDFLDIDIMDKEGMVPRKADLRAFVLMGEEPRVWKSGLTRFSRNPDSFIVNSSQGGGFKDTGVLSQ